MFGIGARVVCVVGGGVAVAASAMALAIPSAASATVCAQATATSVMSSSSQSACWRPFTSSSPVNMTLPSNPALESNSTAIDAHMSQYGWHFGDSTSGFTFNENDGTRPVYFGAVSDPTYTIRCTYQEGPGTCQGSNGININDAVVHVPAGAQPGNNWDAHMIIVQSATGAEYDLWHTTISGSTITAGNGSETNVNTSDGTGGAGDAAGLALTAGLLTPQQLASGHIDHALAIDIPCTNATSATSGYVWPAAGGWGEACGDYWTESTSGAPSIGQLFRLNLTASQIANSGAPAWEQTIMTALATYGAYAEDTNGNWDSEQITIFSTDPTGYTSVGQPNAWNTAISQLGGSNGTLSSNVSIPVSDLVAVNPCVPQGTCPNLTGPGTTSPDPGAGSTNPSASGSTTGSVSATASATTSAATSSSTTPAGASGSATASSSAGSSTTGHGRSFSHHAHRGRSRSTRAQARLRHVAARRHRR